MNTRQINILIAVFDESPGSLASAIGEKVDAVSTVLHDKRPRLAVRRKLADHLSRKVYEALGLPPEEARREASA